MPVVDVCSYSQTKTVPLFMELIKEFQDGSETGKRPPAHIYYLNVFLGSRYLLLPPTDAFVTFGKDQVFGRVIIALYEVERRTLIKDEDDDHGGERVSCITILWQCDEFRSSFVSTGLDFADETLRDLELATGFACPVTINSVVLGENFPIWHLDLASLTYVQTHVKGNTRRLPELKPLVVQSIGAMHGGPSKYTDLMATEPYALVGRSARWQQKAIRALASRDWEGCVVACAVWIETLTVPLTVQLSEIVAKPVPDLRSALRPGLPHFLVTRLAHQVLGEEWDQSDASSHFGAWYRDCYRQRNRIAHEGAIASDKVAKSAYDASHEFARYLTRRMAHFSDPRASEFTRLFQGMQTSKD